jgi:hypothetical protein
MSFGSIGRLTLLIGGILLFADLFLAWQRLCIRVGVTEQVCADRSGWYGFGIAVGLATIALLAWAGIELAGVELPPRGASLLAEVVLVLVAIEFATRAERRHWPAWLGLALGIAIGAAGAAALFPRRDPPPEPG